MNEPNVKGDKPDYKGRLEIAAWENTDKAGKPYLLPPVGLKPSTAGRVKTGQVNVPASSS